MENFVVVSRTPVVSKNPYRVITNKPIKIDLNDICDWTERFCDFFKKEVLLLTFEKSLESIMMSLEASFGKNRRNKYIKIKFEEV